MDHVAHHVLRFDRFALDLTRGRLQAHGRDIDLPPKPFALLRYLAENPGRLISKDELHQVIWPNLFVSDDSLVQCVRELREKLSDADHRLIRTTPRRGYMLDATVEVSAEPWAAEPRPSDPGESPVAPDRPARWRPRKLWPWATAAAALVVGGVALATLRSAPPAPMAARPAPVVTAPRLSLAVLPFQAVGLPPEMRHLADSVADEVRTRLPRISPGRIIARGPTVALQSRAITTPTMGEALGARFLVEGAVQQEAGQLRVTARLVEAASGAAIWTETSDWNPLQTPPETLAIRFTRRFMVDLFAAEAARSLRERRDNPDALDYLIRARDLTYRLPRGSELSEPKRLYLEAARRDEGLTGAWRGLASAWLRHARFSPMREDNLARAEEAAERAIARWQHSSDNHVMRGWVRYEQHRMEDALIAFDHAVKLDPGNVDALSGKASVLVMLGRPQEALALIERITAISPLDIELPRWQMTAGTALLHLNRDAEAVDMLRRSAARMPGEPMVHLYLASALSLSGRPSEARAALAELVRLAPAYSLERLKALETSEASGFREQRARLYAGLMRIDLRAGATGGAN